ncbi:hypothetical protein H8356DRAFT_1297815 [Neocallimastix lanati (nom. inval.)]|uniref:Uncharacterized protein n=1 Tax=Neocallimastix californiae TaxID=1754190 RepID=A0A1Y1YN50_9FUNG|nr:hypothetical protein H8356DRAFT_1297815 [Neocallimastix sp. JGI-2020a]ORX99395.1 hypothetical protein LY90DRAFT_709546 [Neocallimastix californiae]|eukprot:ORX99395.1 hypothetical protein LY90DRAFT_709546 [Neocallimastix californiae]
MTDNFGNIIKPTENGPTILPEKFQRPELWNYNIKKQNLLYTTTNNDYGFYKPTLVEMPTKYYSSNQEFTENLSMAGNYRNFGLNP